MIQNNQLKLHKIIKFLDFEFWLPMVKSWYTEGKMNLQNSNQGSMKQESFVSNISILILNIEETLFETVH